jgi:hypothetical protein
MTQKKHYAFAQTYHRVMLGDKKQRRKTATAESPLKAFTWHWSCKMSNNSVFPMRENRLSFRGEEIIFSEFLLVSVSSVQQYTKKIYIID